MDPFPGGVRLEIAPNAVAVPPLIRLGGHKPISVILGCYHDQMAVIKYAKRSISLPVELDEELERQAATEGTTVSALLATAAEHSMRLKRGLAAVAEWQTETGVAFSADEIAEVDSLLDAAGVGYVKVTASPETRSRLTSEATLK